MTFGKIGRPPEDRLLRQREIYIAVSPLLLTIGARRLSMRQAAQAACLSIGGLYHYFPTKRDLVLHGLDLAARSRLCLEFRERIKDTLTLGVHGYIECYLEHSVRIISFIRPAVHSALDLGVDEFRAALDSGLNANLQELQQSLSLLMPEENPEHLEHLARTIRRLDYGSLLDANFDPHELYSQLRALLEGYVLKRDLVS